MPVSAITYLILAAISVLIAVALFVKLWNVFIGSNTTQLDMNAMAGIIEQMEKDGKQYEQVPFILQIGDNTIFGLDKTERTIKYAPSNDISKIIHYPGNDEPTECKNSVCLCRATGDKVESCVALSIPNGKELLLAADYNTFMVSVQPKKDARLTIPQALKQYEQKDSPDESQFGNHDMLRSFIISTSLANAFESTASTNSQPATQTATTTLAPKAIIPLIIEKQVIGNTIVITVMPDSKYARGRSFYLQQCPSNNDPAACKGKTGVDSVVSNGKGGEKYCAVDILDDTCNYAPLSSCPQARAIDTPCRCGADIVTFGFCSHETHLAFECDVIKDCSDYCKQDGGKRDLTTTEGIGRAVGGFVAGAGTAIGSVVTPGSTVSLSTTTWEEELDTCSTAEINICQGISISSGQSGGTPEAVQNAPHDTVCGLDCQAQHLTLSDGHDVWVCRPRTPGITSSGAITSRTT